ncbi:signal recognition particle receptor beta subunit-domain-containing protein [Amylostereum chailletii]|nr:signal recognition particle receptor beta subunit-domain-containing protein [Amylostereum chailletii]
MSDPASTPSHVIPEVLHALSLTPRLLLIVSLGLAVFAVVLAVWFKRKTSSRGNALLFVGPPDSGKTALLSMLVYKQMLPTHASMQINTSMLTLAGRPPISVVDVPGHPRIRDQFKDHLADARALIFVVDASTVSRNGPEVAEHLHYILNAVTSLPPSQTPPALVILAHKSDLLKSSSASAAASSEQLAINRVRTVLERELEKRRASQTGSVGMEGLGAEGEEGTELGGLECSGPSGGVFKFSEWEGGEIEFLGTCVSLWERLDVDDEKTGGGKGVAGLVQWIESLA